VNTQAKAVTGLATTLTSTAASLISALGIKSAVSDGNSWVGSDGPWTVDFTNSASDDVSLAVWGAASWVNANNPSVLVTLAPGQKTTVSFKNGASGGFAGIYKDTQLRMGQIDNTWGEFTFGMHGVVDVSREVNMNGHALSITSPNGCVSDMNNCVFVCTKDGSGNRPQSCWHEYELLQSSNGNCIKGQDPNLGGADSGGCSLGPNWNGGKLQVVFGN
jgi:hypothetical protein